jgi:hypothetical protein
LKKFDERNFQKMVKKKKNKTHHRTIILLCLIFVVEEVVVEALLTFQMMNSREKIEMEYSQGMQKEKDYEQHELMTEIE